MWFPPWSQLHHVILRGYDDRHLLLGMPLNSLSARFLFDFCINCDRVQLESFNQLADIVRRMDGHSVN
jgi:hypothetical protein